MALKGKEAIIQGYIDIKRTRYFARKYVQIIDGFFFYYKEKGLQSVLYTYSFLKFILGSLTPRGVYSLSEAHIQERHENKSEHYIIFKAAKQYFKVKGLT